MHKAKKVQIALGFGAAVLLAVPAALLAAEPERPEISSQRVGADDFNAVGIKLRGDGSVDDNQPGMVRRDDDIGPDGLKRRGDGTIDDDQPGADVGQARDRLIHDRTKNREVLDDGTAVRSRSDRWVTPDGAVVRERSDTRSVLPDGSLVRQRTETRFDAGGNIVRQRNETRSVQRNERAERVGMARAWIAPGVLSVKSISNVRSAPSVQNVRIVQNVPGVIEELPDWHCDIGSFMKTCHGAPARRPPRRSIFLAPGK